MKSPTASHTASTRVSRASLAISGEKDEFMERGEESGRSEDGKTCIVGEANEGLGQPQAPSAETSKKIEQDLADDALRYPSAWAIACKLINAEQQLFQRVLLRAPTGHRESRSGEVVREVMNRLQHQEVPTSTSRQPVTEDAEPSPTGENEQADQATGQLPVLSRLSSLCRQHGRSDLASQLDGLSPVVLSDMIAMETRIGAMEANDGPVSNSASHLLALGGKRLRPMCLSLAARIGEPDSEVVCNLATAVELTHSASLLHDDVIDLGDQRRGQPTARLVYGNAASVFAGDKLLIEAIRCVRGASMPDLLDRLLATIDEIIEAESLQLEARGHLQTDANRYLDIVRGKTASLFRWALYAGGRAGQLRPSASTALESFGLHLGTAFQVLDDLLDFRGDAARTGKNLFVDLAEGKVTYPLLVAMQRQPSLSALVNDVVILEPGQGIPDHLVSAILAAIESSGGFEEANAFAHQETRLALEALESVPDHPARRGLATLCETLTLRKS
ncbi:MAG TPA: hypothetical protein DIU15_09905 [Deltaproteobacteria bacterium]|nr:hypothetical protein [Deltaproteobacteria bacterium]